MKETIIISRELYDRMKDRTLFLAALEGAGVERWEKYHVAKEVFLEGRGKEYTQATLGDRSI